MAESSQSHPVQREVKGNRIALFVPSLQGGGAERVMVTLANAFVQHGQAVDLVLPLAEGIYRKELRADVRVVDLGSRTVFASLRPLTRYLRNVRPQAMLSALDHANVVAVWAKLLAGRGTRLVVSEHSVVETGRKFAGGLRQRALPLLMRLFYPAADRVVAVSEGVADDLVSSIGIDRAIIDVIHNPVVSEALLVRSREETGHPWFGADQRLPVVLAVGRLEPEKDFETLIRAFALLRKRQRARLLVLGEGSLRGELTRLVESLGLQDEVSMPGFAPNPFPFMRRADLFVLSSAHEGLPTALIEAMACGTPVISTDCPAGPREILQGGQWGVLVPVGDVQVLAQEMAAALQRPHHPDVERRAQDFAVERAVDGYLKALLGAGGSDRGTALRSLTAMSRGGRSK